MKYLMGLTVRIQCDEGETEEECRHRVGDILGQLVTTGASVMQDKMLRNRLEILKLGIIARKENEDDNFDTPVDLGSECTNSTSHLENERG